VIAYYTGNAERLQQFPLDKLTHIIYSFVKLQNDTLMLRDAEQEQTVQQIVALKKKYPQLKIMVSMGGWSACAPCSDLFADARHRKTFAQTTVALLSKYNLDGIDLDWEYPAIEGFPGISTTLPTKNISHNSSQPLGKRWATSICSPLLLVALLSI
jgi:chitinase